MGLQTGVSLAPGAEDCLFFTFCVNAGRLGKAGLTCCRSILALSVSEDVPCWRAALRVAQGGEVSVRLVPDLSSVAPPAFVVVETFFEGAHSSGFVVRLWRSPEDRGAALGSRHFFSFFSTILVLDLVGELGREVDVLAAGASADEEEEACRCWLQLCQGSRLECSSPAREQGRGSALAPLNTLRHTALARFCPQCNSWSDGEGVPSSFFRTAKGHGRRDILFSTIATFSWAVFRRASFSLTSSSFSTSFLWDVPAFWGTYLAVVGAERLIPSCFPSDSVELVFIQFSFFSCPRFCVFSELVFFRGEFS